MYSAITVEDSTLPLYHPLIQLIPFTSPYHHGSMKSAIWSTQYSPARRYAHKLCELEQYYPN